jgi:ubiquinone/menaquinone biosynthesis C-methylase UbiE
MSDPGEIFASAAPYYARHRRPYDPRAFPAIARAFGLGAASTVLDLGTGTGGVARGMAPLVGRVVAVDPAPDMLAQARQGTPVGNVQWRLGDSTRLAELAPDVAGGVDAVTMGRSFHWMDRPAVLAVLDRLVAAGGGVALLRTLERGLEGDAPRPAWVEAVRRVVDRYALPRDHAVINTEDHVRVLAESAFARVETITFGHTDVTLTVDDVVGTQFSYSFTSPARLGDRRAAFEADLRAELLAVDPAGRYPLGPVVTELVLATRPRPSSVRRGSRPPGRSEANEAGRGSSAPRAKVG